MSTLRLPRIDEQSRRHQVLRALREAIAVGELRPGDRLVEADVARQMGVSRAPVREALRQLEQEGLVVSYPYRGTEVLGVSTEEVEEVLVPIRLVLEHFAVRRALHLLREEDLRSLAELVGVMRDAADTGDLGKLADADIRFHELIIDRSNQPHCAQIWRTIAPRLRISFLRAAPAHPSALDVADEHEQVLIALRSGDEARVAAVLTEHISNLVEFAGKQDEVLGADGST